MVLTGACQFGHGVGEFATNFIHSPDSGAARRTLHRAPVGQGPLDPDSLAITALGFWSGRALATGTAWAGLRLIHHHQLAQHEALFI